MMRKFILPMAFAVLTLVLGSCATTKNVPYFKNVEFYDES